MRNQIFAAVGAAGLLFAGSTILTASAAPTAAPAPANSVNSAAIVDGQVWQKDLAPAFVKALYGVYDNTVTTPSIKTGAVTEDKLSDAVKSKLTLGKGVSATFAPVTLAHIGGPFKAGKTKLGQFTLPAGTWLINSSAFFARTTAGVAGTRPELALRVGASDTAFGEDYGTILGAEISPTKDRELTGSTIKVKTVTADTVVEVFGFGYNDDTGTAGSGDITASADVTAVRIGS